MRRFMVALFSLLAASCAAGSSEPADAPDPGQERFPVSSSYPPGTMDRINFTAAGPESWRISALKSPDRPEARWKVVIITGTPSWSEYWAPTIAALPDNREIIVADRPGFSESEPRHAVPDIAAQAEALSPMLETRPGERVVLVGQSFGGPVATLMAARYPDQVDALVLVSAYFGQRGPTARRLFGVGRIVQPFLPRDLKNSISEVRAQPRQLPEVWSAFDSLDIPVVFIHGDKDTFVPLDSAREIAGRRDNTLITVPEGDHFLNACCVPALLGAVEQAIAEADAATDDTAAPTEHAQ